MPTRVKEGEHSLVHVGYRHERTTVKGQELEGVLSKLWAERNSRKADFLRVLLAPEGSENDVPTTQRDAHVAATVIQWLGTNGGMCFLREAFRETGHRLHYPDRGA